MSGKEVIEAISQGRLWLNLRRTSDVDSRYRTLLKSVFDELHERVPNFVSYGERCGILISSPNAHVYYHADLPGQMLFQIAGRKRAYLYPPQKPFLSPEDLEQIAISGLELDMPYADWYDDYARIYELEPGQMMFWPLNAPHRIENHDCLNISMTVEFFSDAIRRTNVCQSCKWGFAPPVRFAATKPRHCRTCFLGEGRGVGRLSEDILACEAKSAP